MMQRWLYVLGILFLFTAGTAAQDSNLLDDLTLRCRTGEDAFVRHMEQGGYFYGARDFQAALAEYSCAILTAPQESPLPYHSRGRVLLDMAQYDGAIADFTRVLELDETDETVYNDRAFAYYALGRTTEALTDYERALALHPDYALAYNNRGLAYLQMGDYTAALADFERALKHDFDRPEWAMTNAGIALAAMGEEEEAIRRFLEAINAAPEFAEPYRRVADIYYDMGDYENALKQYRNYAALIDDGIDAVARQRVEDLQFRQNFIRLLPTIVIVIVVDGALLIEIAGRLRASRRRRHIAGTTALLLIAVVWPMSEVRAQGCARTDAAGYYARAVEMAQAGILDDALAAIDCAILHDNTFTAAYEVRVNLNARLAQWDAVIDDYNRLILLHSGMADYYIGRGNAYAALSLENPIYSAQAIADFEQAIALNSESPAPYIGLGNLMASHERYNDAVVYYEAALARNSEDVLALRNAAMAYANMGDYEAAEARLQAALSFAPEDMTTQDLLAELEALRNTPEPHSQQVIVIQQQTALPSEQPNLTALSATLWLMAIGVLLALVWRRLKALRVYGGRR